VLLVDRMEIRWPVITYTHKEIHNSCLMKTTFSTSFRHLRLHLRPTTSGEDRIASYFLDALVISKGGSSVKFYGGEQMFSVPLEVGPLDCG